MTARRYELQPATELGSQRVEALAIADYRSPRNATQRSAQP